MAVPVATARAHGRAVHRRAQRPWPLYPSNPRRTYVNVGFWSSVPADPGGADGAANRLIENKVGGTRRTQIPVLRLLLHTRRVRGAVLRRWRLHRTQEAVRPRIPAYWTSTSRRCNDNDHVQGPSLQPTCDPADDKTPPRRRSSKPSPTAPLPLRFTAYDGSRRGPGRLPLGLHLESPAGATYSRPHPATSAWRAPTSPATSNSRRSSRRPVRDACALMDDELHFGARPPATLAQHRPVARPGTAACRSRRRRRNICPAGAASRKDSRHSKNRDAEVIHHHYDVSNTFYEYVLGPSMTYTCASLRSETRHSTGPGEQVPPGLRQARPASPVTACSTSAAAGARWCATPPAAASRRSA